MLALSLCIALALGAECGPTDLTLVTDGYFPTEARVTLSDDIKSKHFDIKYGTNFKVVTNLYAREQYVLTHCGSTAPTDEEVNAVAPLPAASAGGSGGAKCGTMACEDGGPFVRKSFTIPLQSYGDETGTTHGFLAILGVTDRISHLSSYAVAPCMQKALFCNASMSTPGTWGDATLRLAHLAGTDAMFVSYAADGAAMPEKTVAMTSSWDPNMLHRAEWIKYLAAFFNKEDKAEEHFRALDAKWTSLSKPGAADKVALSVSSTTYGSHSPGASLRLELDPLKVMWVEASGAKAVTQAAATASGKGLVAGCTPQVSNCDIDFDAEDADAVAAFHAIVATADVIVDETYAYAPADYNADSFATTFKYASTADAPTGKVYRQDKRATATGSTDMYENGYAQPHLLLQDLSLALGTVTGEERYFMRKLDEAPTLFAPEHCDKPVPACDAALSPAVIEAPCETYQTCITLDTLTGDGSTAESAAAAAALLFAAMQL